MITSNYFEISDVIMEYDAGWVVSPSEEGAIKRVVSEILEHREIVNKKGRNAQKLVGDKFVWGKGIEPLSKFCSSPFKHERKEIMLSRIMSENSQIKFDILGVKEENEYLRGELERTRENEKRGWDNFHRVDSELKDVKEEFRQAKDQLDYIRNSLPYRIMRGLKHLLSPAKR